MLFRVCQNLLCLTAFFCLSTPVLAQSGLWAHKMLDVERLDFGAVATGAECRTRIKVTNTFLEPVELTGLRTGCACAQASQDFRSLESRKDGFIDVWMDTNKFKGKRDTYVEATFYCAAKGAVETVRVPITAYIRTDVVVEPGSANFGNVDQGQGKKLTLHIAYAGRPDWKIMGLQNRSQFFDLEHRETARAGGRVNYDIDVTMKPTTPAGIYRETFHLMTDDQNSPLVPIQIVAQVESEFTMTPATLVFGTMAPGQKKSLTVAIRCKKPFAIEEVTRGKDDESLTFKSSKDAKPVHVLPITFLAPENAGNYEDDITLSVAGRKEPLVIHVQAKITAPPAAAVNTGKPSAD